MMSRQQRRALEKANAAFPPCLVPVHPEEWPAILPGLQQVWRSSKFLVQVFNEPGSMVRLSVCRTSHNGDSWVDNITWDELMQIKREIGMGDRDAVEIFPADKDIVNVANMRHLWVTPSPIMFAWRKK